MDDERMAPVRDSAGHEVNHHSEFPYDKAIVINQDSRP